MSNFCDEYLDKQRIIDGFKFITLFIEINKDDLNPLPPIILLKSYSEIINKNNITNLNEIIPNNNDINFIIKSIKHNKMCINEDESYVLDKQVINEFELLNEEDMVNELNNHKNILLKMHNIFINNEFYVHMYTLMERLYVDEFYVFKQKYNYDILHDSRNIYTDDDTGLIWNNVYEKCLTDVESSVLQEYEQKIKLLNQQKYNENI